MYAVTQTQVEKLSMPLTAVNRGDDLPMLADMLNGSKRTKARRRPPPSLQGHFLERAKQLHAWGHTPLVQVRHWISPEAGLRLPLQLERHPDDSDTNSVHLVQCPRKTRPNGENSSTSFQIVFIP